MQPIKAAFLFLQTSTNHHSNHKWNDPIDFGLFVCISSTYESETFSIFAQHDSLIKNEE